MARSMSELRHGARGSLNAIKLCIAAMELPGSRDEVVEFLDEVIRASDELSVQVDEMGMLFDQGTAPSATHI